jgi:hypothetical protein
MLYFYIYLYTFQLQNPGRADHIGGYIFGGIYLLFIIWTNVIVSLFLCRLNPKKLTEEEAKKKAQIVAKDKKGDKKEGDDKDKKDDDEDKETKDEEKKPKLDKDGNPIKEDLECKKFHFFEI